MKPKPTLAGIALLLAGLVAGVYLQHRWPLGRLAHDLRQGPPSPAGDIAAISNLPSARRLVLLVAGQSNAANYGEIRRAAGLPVYAFANGALFAAVDPLPGADGDGGSIWTRLGARLALTGNYDAIVIAVVAEGSTRLDDWTPGGRCHDRLLATLQQLAAAKLTPEYLLWQQGESEAASPFSAGRDYLAKLHELASSCRALFPQIAIVIANATYGSSPAINEQIRLAQTSAARLPNAIAGPDLDTLGADYRRDGLHFNDRGLTAAADLWLAALHDSLARRNEERHKP